jgi:hypothetical protein
MDTGETRIGNWFNVTSRITGAAFDLPKDFGL